MIPKYKYIPWPLQQLLEADDKEGLKNYMTEPNHVNSSLVTLGCAKFNAPKCMEYCLMENNSANYNFTSMFQHLNPSIEAKPAIHSALNHFDLIQRAKMHHAPEVSYSKLLRSNFMDTLSKAVQMNKVAAVKAFSAEINENTPCPLSTIGGLVVEGFKNKSIASLKVLLAHPQVQRDKEAASWLLAYQGDTSVNLWTKMCRKDKKLSSPSDRECVDVFKDLIKAAPDELQYLLLVTAVQDGSNYMLETLIENAPGYCHDFMAQTVKGKIYFSRSLTAKIDKQFLKLCSSYDMGTLGKNALIPPDINKQYMDTNVIPYFTKRKEFLVEKEMAFNSYSNPGMLHIPDSHAESLLSMVFLDPTRNTFPTLMKYSDIDTTDWWQKNIAHIAVELLPINKLALLITLTGFIRNLAQDSIHLFKQADCDEKTPVNYLEELVSSEVVADTVKNLCKNLLTEINYLVLQETLSTKTTSAKKIKI